MRVGPPSTSLLITSNPRCQYSNWKKKKPQRAFSQVVFTLMSNAYYLQEGVEDFENSTKKSFDRTNSEYRITIRSCNLTKPEIQMRRGSIKVLGEKVQSFFDEFIDQIISGIQQQMQGTSCNHLLLVGGFGESPYLRQTILTKFNTHSCAVTIANDSTSKAVSDGAVIWCAKSSVISRATRVKYGTNVSIPYDEKNPAHQGRRYFDPSDGRSWARNSWSQIVDKGVVISETNAISQKYRRTMREIPQSITATTSIYAWTDDTRRPGLWLANTEGYVLAGFEYVCKVHATVDNLQEIAKKRVGPDGVYYEISFRIALRFGGTEFYAQLEWEHNGKTRSSPATIIPRALKDV